uniref:Uncharacterized protein n=1 Tax=Steinernema glaseri TaxID=37863 RepID=A0A1I7ZU66_9BILA
MGQFVYLTDGSCHLLGTVGSCSWTDDGSPCSVDSARVAPRYDDVSLDRRRVLGDRRQGRKTSAGGPLKEGAHPVPDKGAHSKGSTNRLSRSIRVRSENGKSSSPFEVIVSQETKGWVSTMEGEKENAGDLPFMCDSTDVGEYPTIAQLVERRTVVLAEILRSLVRIRLVGFFFHHFLLSSEYFLDIGH